MKKIFFMLLVLTTSQFSQWLKQTTPADINALLCIDFYNQNAGVAGGWKFSDDYMGRVIYTTNSGNNWIASSLPDSVRTIVKIQLLTQSTGFLTGSYNTNIFYYPNQQRNFSQINKYPVFTENFYRRICLDYYVYNYKGMFLKTSNGGQSWFNVGSLPSNIINVVGLKFVNSNTGFITAILDNISSNRYEILKSTNGGLFWTSLIIKDSVILSDIFTFDGYNIFIGGSKFTNGTPNGIILKSTNGGINWVSQNISNTIQIIDLAFTNTTTGFAVAESWGILCHILKTTDLGYSWAVSSTLQLNTILNSIEFANGTGKGIATGDDNLTSFPRPLIYRTTNYGANWRSYSIPDTNSFFDQSLINQDIWFVCGGIGDALIYKSSNGGEIGIKRIGDQVPTTFLLSQNYPNPFNPTTHFGFRIAEFGLVRLTVFDVLGKEVQVLVNQQLQPGSYESDWDASAYPSGVYYYKLEVNDPSTPLRVTETKKMVLIR